VDTQDLFLYELDTLCKKYGRKVAVRYENHFNTIREVDTQILKDFPEMLDHAIERVWVDLIYYIKEKMKSTVTVEPGQFIYKITADLVVLHNTNLGDGKEVYVC
jgi:hypothetical protein